MTYGLYLDKLYTDCLDGSKRDAHADLQRFFKELAKTGEESNYGLAYRIARSRYAVNSYRRVLPDLRIDRIPGWQPYDEFVRRRLYSVFDTIDIVGQRLDALRQRATVLLDIQHTRSLVYYQELADVLVVLAGTYYLGSMLAEFAKWLKLAVDQDIKPISFVVAGLLMLGWKLFVGRRRH